MKIMDFECQECGAVEEHFMTDDYSIGVCSECGGESHKIFTARQTTPIDADWIAGCLAVVDKSGKKPWCNEFLKHPTRANLKEWMSKEGLRHRDPAEPHFKQIDLTSRRENVKKKMLESYLERNRLVING